MIIKENSPEIKHDHINSDLNVIEQRVPIEVEEVECDIDEDFDNEKFTGKMINNSFINKLKDFSTFNPSGNKGREKLNNSLHILIP